MTNRFNTVWDFQVFRVLAVSVCCLLAACETMNLPAQSSSKEPQGNPVQQSANQEANPSPLQNAGQKTQGTAAQTAEKASQTTSSIFGQSGESESEQGATPVSQSAAKDTTAQDSTSESSTNPEQPQQTSKSGLASQFAGQDSATQSSNSGAGQQAAQEAQDTNSSSTQTSDSSSRLPWHQRMAGRSMNKKVAEKEEIRRQQEIKRVIIEPSTGLYVDTKLSSSNVGASSNMSFENRQADLLEWAFWQLEGRIGLTVEKDSYNGSLNWEQEGDALDFRFRGPLGFGGVRIHGELGSEVRVKTTRGEEFFLQDIEVDMQRQLGWSMPINSLRYWCLGITDPEQDAEVVLNENDLLDEMQQGDWKIVYDNYTEVDGVMLPRKFKITGPKTKIKLVVNEWTIPEAE